MCTRYEMTLETQMFTEAMELKFLGGCRYDDLRLSIHCVV